MPLERLGELMRISTRNHKDKFSHFFIGVNPTTVGFIIYQMADQRVLNDGAARSLALGPPSDRLT